MTSKHYPAYLKEYQDQTYLETNSGFITYKILPEQETIFVPVIYVAPEYRNSGKAYDLMDQAEDIGRDAGCKILLGMVQMDYHNKETSLKCALAYGMKIISSSASEIYLSKEL